MLTEQDGGRHIKGCMLAHRLKICGNTQAHMWNLGFWHAHRKFCKSHAASIPIMCISSFPSGGADLVSCGGSGVVRLRNAAHSRLLWGKYLFTADRQRTLKTWDIQVVAHTGYTVYCLSAAVNRTNAHWNYMPPWHFCTLWESQESMTWKWQRRRDRWRLVNTEPKEIKRQTVGDWVNLDISIRSGMLFTLEMTALSVILKPLLPPEYNQTSQSFGKSPGRHIGRSNVPFLFWYFKF